ncbi:hypothetical protein ES703_86209 [subsurface metagenome]
MGGVPLADQAGEDIYEFVQLIEHAYGLNDELVPLGSLRSKLLPREDEVYLSGELVRLLEPYLLRYLLKLGAEKLSGPVR